MQAGPGVGSRRGQPHTAASPSGVPPGSGPSCTASSSTKSARAAAWTGRAARGRGCAAPRAAARAPAPPPAPASGASPAVAPCHPRGGRRSPPRTRPGLGHRARRRGRAVATGRGRARTPMATAGPSPRARDAGGECPQLQAMNTEQNMESSARATGNPLPVCLPGAPAAGRETG